MIWNMEVDRTFFAFMTQFPLHKKVFIEGQEQPIYLTCCSFFSVYITFPGAPIQLYPHTHSPWILSSRDKSNTLSYQRWFNLAQFSGIGVGVTLKFLKYTKNKRLVNVYNGSFQISFLYAFKNRSSCMRLKHDQTFSYNKNIQ